MGVLSDAITAGTTANASMLRTLVLGLITMHSSEALNLVLVDFKGGATFAGHISRAALLRRMHQLRGLPAALARADPNSLGVPTKYNYARSPMTRTPDRRASSGRRRYGPPMRLRLRDVVAWLTARWRGRRR
jgi:hypothetical protein